MAPGKRSNMKANEFYEGLVTGRRLARLNSEHLSISATPRLYDRSSSLTKLMIPGAIGVERS